MARRLIHDLVITLPRLPAALDGLRIAHLTDLHIAGPRRRHQQTIDELDALELDLIFLTGDYISHKGQEAASARAMTKITAGLHARLGVLGVFGNHDTPALRQAVAGLPVRWLCNECIHPPGLPLEVLGIDTDHRMKPDAVALLKGWHLARERARAGGAETAGAEVHGSAFATAGAGAVPDRGQRGAASTHAHRHAPAPDTRDGPRTATTPGDPDQRPLRILLSHLPMFLASAGDMGIDLMFSGHTHGGQCRLPRGRALINSSDLPLHLTSGILRHQHTVCVVSRGLGEMTLPIRFLCPPHLPVVTLRRGPLPGQATDHIENVRPW